MIDLITEFKPPAFKREDVIGRNIVCEDGVTRRVESITESFRYPDMMIVNEVIEDDVPGGSWVHVLSLSRQMHGNSLPTPEEKRAFSKAMWATFQDPANQLAGSSNLKPKLVVPN